jgi:transitional endoplasmic reticulum ATPase
MEILQLFHGDTIIVRHNIFSFPCSEFISLLLQQHDTVLIFLSSDDVEEGRIQMNKVAHNNLQVKPGDLVNIHQCLDIKYGKCVHILPFNDLIESLGGNIFEVYLKPYCLEGKINITVALELIFLNY